MNIVSWAVIVEDGWGQRGRRGRPALDPLNKGGLGCFDEDRPVALDVYLDINPGMNRTGCPLDIALETASAIRRRRALRQAAHVRRPRRRATQGARGDRRELDAALFQLYDRCWRSAARSARLHAHRRDARHPLEHRARRPRGDGPPPRSAGTIVLEDTGRSTSAPWVWNRPGRREPLRVEPTEGVYTLDAGVKALAADAGDPLCQIIGKTGYTLRKASEEHLPWNATRSRGRRAVSRAEASTDVAAETALWVEDDGVIGPRGVECHRVNVHARAPAWPTTGPSTSKANGNGLQQHHVIFPRISDGTGGGKTRGLQFCRPGKRPGRE